MQRAGHRADGPRQARRHVGSGARDHPGGEGGGVHPVLGGGHPVGVDSLGVLGVRLAAPADHEPLDHGGGPVHLTLRDHRPVHPAGGLRDEGQRHHRGPGEVLAGGVGVDVEQRAEAPDRGQLGECALHVHPDVAGVHRQRERFGGGQAGVELVVHQQPPHVAEAHPADEILDVDPPVAQRAPGPVGLGDLCLEGEHSFKPWHELGHHTLPRVRPAGGAAGGTERRSTGWWWCPDPLHRREPVTAPGRILDPMTRPGPAGAHWAP